MTYGVTIDEFESVSFWKKIKISKVMRKYR
jgi:hypothetical protein